MNRTASNTRLKASLEELARLGSPVDLSVVDMEVENKKVEIEQVGGRFESQIFQLQNRRVAYIADIAVTNQTSRSIDVIDVQLQTPWDNRLFEWVTPFQVEVTPLQVKLQGRAKRENPFVYEFPGERALRFAYDEVINHHLLEARKLQGKRRLQGLLLGIGDFMPDNLVHGELLEMALTIIGVDRAEYSEPIRFWTERLLAPPKIVKTRTSIFAELVEEEAVRARDAYQRSRGWTFRKDFGRPEDENCETKPLSPLL
jgi:hypothetical protein